MKKILILSALFSSLSFGAYFSQDSYTLVTQDYIDVIAKNTQKNVKGIKFNEKCFIPYRSPIGFIAKKGNVLLVKYFELPKNYSYPKSLYLKKSEEKKKCPTETIFLMDVNKWEKQKRAEKKIIKKEKAFEKDYKWIEKEEKAYKPRRR